MIEGKIKSLWTFNTTQAVALRPLHMLNRAGMSGHSFHLNIYPGGDIPIIFNGAEIRMAPGARRAAEGINRLLVGRRNAVMTSYRKPRPSELQRVMGDVIHAAWEGAKDGYGGRTIPPTDPWASGWQAGELQMPHLSRGISLTWWTVTDWRGNRWQNRRKKEKGI